MRNTCHVLSNVMLLKEIFFLTVFGKLVYKYILRITCMHLNYSYFFIYDKSLECLKVKSTYN